MKVSYLFLLLLVAFYRLTFTVQPRFGVVHHFGNPHVSKSLNEVKQDVKNMKSLGFDFVREGIYWDNIKSIS